MLYLGIDPFAVKRLSRVHPLRVAFTAYARGADAVSRATHNRNALREIRQTWTAVGDYSQPDTAVTPEQMAALLHFQKEAEAIPGAMVEIGAFRGVTTAMLAHNTDRRIYAVDPFGGYGGAEQDFAKFRANTAGLANVTHLRATSGAAAKAWDEGAICFIFVDAVHDYVNTIFDARTWGDMLAPGGYLALHDTDNSHFPGTRRAALEMSKRMKLVCHVPDLTILQKTA